LILSDPVKFDDNKPSDTDQTAVVVSPWPKISTPGTDLGNWFARPLQVYTFTWDNTASTTAIAYPLALYFANTDVAARLKGYALARFKLCMRIQHNGTPFHWGALAVGYYPIKLNDGYGVNATNWQHAFQGPGFHVRANSTQAQELKVPFFYIDPYFDLTGAVSATAATDYAALLFANTPAVLTHSAIAVPTLAVNLYVWLEDLELAAPTPWNFLPTCEYIPCSEIVGAVGRVFTAGAGFMKAIGLPVPALNAAATVSGRLATGLRHMGLSAPTADYSTPRVRTNAQGNYQLTNVLDYSEKLADTVEQSLSVSPGDVGADPVDHMSLSHIASQWGLMGYVGWHVNDATDAQLCAVPVAPMAIPGGIGGHTCWTPVAFASAPFTFWCGGLEFRFTVFCNDFHRGRLRIRYVPYPGGALPTPQNYTNAQMCVLDLEAGSVLDATVEWSQPVQVADVGVPWYWLGTAPNAVANRINGYLSIEVQTPLVSNTTVNDTVLIFFEVRGAPSFQAFVAANDKINAYVPYCEYYPCSLDITKCVLGGHAQPPLVPILFGERVDSFRSLVKRFVLQYQCNVDAPVAASAPQAMSMRVGHTGSVPTDPGAFTINSANMYRSWRDWIGYTFAGVRGGTRFKVAMLTTGNGAGIVTVSRYGDATNGADTIWGMLEQHSAKTASAWLLGGTHSFVMTTGGTFQNPIEFELPDFNKHLLRSTAIVKAHSAGYGQQQAVIEWTTTAATFSTNNTIRVFTAGADDFSGVWFLRGPMIT